MATPDRLEALLAQNVVTGIDFVYVHPNQTTLDVFFLRAPATLSVPLVNNLPAAAVRIYSPSGGERWPVVPVQAVKWEVVDARDVLRVETAFPGDFSRYRLRLEDARIDRYFNDAAFSFKANCESQLDCLPPAHECPPEPPVDFPVDYEARDFWSLRRALLDFASQRHPRWRDRLEADVGMMLVEVMSALGDEMAYFQDRVAREAYLETATERRSLRRHARLVDYDLHDGRGATAWLDFEVDAAAAPPYTVTAGEPVWDPSDSVRFEVGRGLDESFAVAPSTKKKYELHPGRNQFAPHQWDEDDVCLPVGATELFIAGHHAADLPFDDAPPGKAPGKWVLLLTEPDTADVKPRAWMVRLVVVEDTTDLVFAEPVTRMRWEPEQATPYELALRFLKVRGNLVPATAGATFESRFTIGASADEDDRPSAVERGGPDDSIAYLFSLPGSDESLLVRLGSGRPEVRLAEVTSPAPGVWTVVPGGVWTHRTRLLGTSSAQPNDAVFTLDDGFWRRVVGYRRIGKTFVHKDYASGAGQTVRFGDGEFGKVPAGGTIFQVTYRLGGGSRANVAAGTLTRCAVPFVKAVTNPLAAADGLDPETPRQVKQLAPEAFRSLPFRAVRTEDYAEAAERLAWVQRAGATLRWTGSWLAAYVTPDPLGAFSVSAAQRAELGDQLNRFRQAGRPAHTLEPRFANLDLRIVVCVEPSAYGGQVKQRVLEVLFGVRGLRPRRGFFSADNFTFGTPLSRPRLEAAIQSVAGVRAVEGVWIRRRGWFGWRLMKELDYRVADNEVVRVENDPLLPERGSVRLDMKGGA